MGSVNEVRRTSRPRVSVVLLLPPPNDLGERFKTRFTLCSHEPTLCGVTAEALYARDHGSQHFVTFFVVSSVQGAKPEYDRVQHRLADAAIAMLRTRAQKQKSILSVWWQELSQVNKRELQDHKSLWTGMTFNWVETRPALTSIGGDRLPADPQHSLFGPSGPCVSPATSAAGGKLPLCLACVW